jgi:FkbM family methyltransferase
MIIFKPHEAFRHIATYISTSPTIVEAGAFIGIDTIKMAGFWPAGVIHAFEPVPALYAELHMNTSSYPNIQTYQLALSSTTGSARFYVSEKPHKPGRATQAGSLHAPKERLTLSPIHFPHTIMVDTMTLDAWADRYAIPSIDLLWLDMQGHELAVLQASPRMLSTVTAIFTEVAFVEAYENQPSVDEMINFLELQGFELIGRDFVDQSQKFFGNLLFIRR